MSHRWRYVYECVGPCPAYRQPLTDGEGQVRSYPAPTGQGESLRASAESCVVRNTRWVGGTWNDWVGYLVGDEGAIMTHVVLLTEDVQTWYVVSEHAMPWLPIRRAWVSPTHRAGVMVLA